MSDDMFSQPVTLNKTSTVTDIVLNNYRTADVFLKYNIEFCCGGKWPLEMVCKANNLDLTKVIEDLTTASSVVKVSNGLHFHNWSTRFLIDYIVNVHHEYLRTAIPLTLQYVNRFMDGHLSKFPWLQQLHEDITNLQKEVLPHLQVEEESFFPYINQITNAYLQNEPYASLLVKTLQKPLQVTMQHEHDLVSTLLFRMREMTNHYSIPVNACVTHRVAFSKLQELDHDLTLHLYLENTILFPRAIEVEKKLLA